MASPRTLARLDALIWTLIFGGLFTLVLGIAAHDDAVVAGWSLSVIGVFAAASGFILIWVRSRLPEDPPAPPPPRQDPETPA
jgi:hypothetical protein